MREPRAVRYNLTTIPTDKPLATADMAVRKTGSLQALVWPEGHYWWSGSGRWAAAPPPVGAPVTVAMNGLGPGTVRGYFIEHGFLGVYVTLDHPPDWWVRQNKNPRTRAMIFGAELGDEEAPDASVS